MRDIDEIWEAYALLESRLDEEVRQNQTSGHPDSIQSISGLERTRQINEHAYFCLAFAQFDQFVRTRHERLVALKAATAAGFDQAARQHIQGNKPDFISMIRILLPGDTPRHLDICKRIKELYRDRNRIIHDANLLLLVELWRAVDELKYISTEIDSVLDQLEATP